MKVEKILWVHSPDGGPLGRNVRHDPRSRQFAFPTMGLSLVSTVHERVAPVWDQGAIGSCTGNAALGCLATRPFYETMAPGFEFTEDHAVGLYGEFTREDPYDGTYPPDDTGSDGLTSAKVLKRLGLISGYQHTFSLNDALLALTVTPWVTGINWYSSFDFPDEDGYVEIKPGAYIRGGHEVHSFALDVTTEKVWFWNSWGSGWGLDGKFCMSFDTFGRLLSEDGDVTVYAPLTAPAPAPTPPSPFDLELAAQSRRWPWVTRNSRAGKAVATWRDKRGL